MSFTPITGFEPHRKTPFIYFFSEAGMIENADYIEYVISNTKGIFMRKQYAMSCDMLDLNQITYLYKALPDFIYFEY
jgi:hypothetical protein